MSRQSSFTIQKNIRIDAICRLFESDWTRDHGVSIQDYLAKGHPADREELLVELIAIEVELRIRKGEFPNPEPYQKAFPDVEHSIARVFEEVVSDLTNQWRKSTTIPIPENLGDFRIVREIGRGAMGIVYEAEQLTLKRQVALKVLPAMLRASVSRLKRFHRESVAIARLHHSHIVEIYGSGEQDGLHFFAMQYVDGQPLCQLLDETDSSKTVSPKEALNRSLFVARIGQQMSEALQYAHDRGVLHRDIKPSNILLDLRENAWLTDFGLAKLKNNEDDSLTFDGDLVGTLRYLAPEAIEGKTDERSDIYSLGLTLYELISHRPAFQKKDLAESIHMLATRKPERIEQRVPGVPRDLSTIIHKAIESDPSARYASAQELADDLKRFLCNEPVRARQMSQLERFVRWSRKNRALSTSLCAIVLLLVTGTFVSTVAAFRFERLEREQRKLTKANAEANTINAAAAAQNAQLAKVVGLERDAAHSALDRANSTAADMYVAYGLQAANEGNDREAVLWFAHALEKSQHDPVRRRANEIRYITWSQRINRPVAEIRGIPRPSQVKFFPGNKFLVTKGFFFDHPDCVFDLENETTLTLQNATAWPPDGTFLAYASKDIAHIKSFPSGAAVLDIKAPEEIHQLAFDPSGQKLAITGEHSLRIVNCQTGQQLSPDWPQEHRPMHLEFSQDGRWLLIASMDKQFHIYKPEQTDVKPWMSGPHLYNNGDWSHRWPTFIEDGRSLVTNPDGATLSVLDLESRTVSFTKPADVSVYLSTNTRNGTVLTSSPNDTTLHFLPKSCYSGWLPTSALAPENTSASVHLNDSLVSDNHAPLQSNSTWSIFRQDCLFADFHHLEPKITVAGSRARVESFDFSQQRRDSIAAIHPPGVTCVTISPDDSLLATVGYASGVRIWKRPPVQDDWLITSKQKGSPSRVIGKFRADSKQLLVHDGSTMQLFDVADRRLVQEKSFDGHLLDVVFGNANRLITINTTPQELREYKGRVESWDATTGELLQTTILPAPPDYWGMHSCEDASTITVRLVSGDVVVVDGATLKIRNTVRVPDGSEFNFFLDKLSPDGFTALIGGEERKQCSLWDLRTGKMIGQLTHSMTIHSVSFSRDSRLIATCSHDETVKIWDAATGSAVSTPLIHPTWAYWAEFSPDSRFLLTVAKDGAARVFDLSTHQLVGAEMQGATDIAAQFRPRTGEVITLDSLGWVNIWDWKQSRQLCPPRRFPTLQGFAFNGTSRITISPDGHDVFIGGMNKNYVISLKDLDQHDDRSVDSILREAEVLSHMRLHDSSRPVWLLDDDWRARWQAWRKSKLNDSE